MYLRTRMIGSCSRSASSMFSTRLTRPPPPASLTTRSSPPLRLLATIPSLCATLFRLSPSPPVPRACASTRVTITTTTIKKGSGFSELGGSQPTDCQYAFPSFLCMARGGRDCFGALIALAFRLPGKRKAWQTKGRVPSFSICVCAVYEFVI